MKRILHHVEHHVEHLRSKPHHVRKQVAFTTAAGVTFVIALAWLVYSAQTGLFSIQGSSFADAVKDVDTTLPQEVQGVSSGLAGVVASQRDDSGAPKLQVVDKTPPAPAKLEQTTIPF